MQDRPVGLTDADLLAACADGWAVEASTADYLPVGAGSYNWTVTDRHARAWFVKVDHAATPDDFSNLRASLQTTLALHRDAGLDFVVAPVPAADGAVLRRLDPGYALSMFPMLTGTTRGFGPHRAEDLPEMVSLLARLHRATPAVAHLTPRTDLRLPGREQLHEALQDLDRPWTTGPYAEPARLLLASHAALVHRWLADFDRLTGAASAAGTPWVVTHGEPHPGNVLGTAAGMRLIDWGTVQLAPPERDLWMLTTAFTGMLGRDQVAEDEEVFARYAEAGGGALSPTTTFLYRRWWELADIAAYLGDLRRPHGDSLDAAASLTHLSRYFEPPG